MRNPALVFVSYFLLFLNSCSNQPHYFTGEIKYQYTYESNTLNIDSLIKQKPHESIFRYDTLNYQSRFIGTDTITYYYSGKLNKCVSQTNSRKNFECEDYSITNDSIISFKIYDTDEIVLGHRCKIIEWQGKYFYNKFYVATDLNISPATYKKHLAYNWKFYGEKTEGGLILKSEHRFKNYTMKGVAVSINKEPNNFNALKIGNEILEKICSQTESIEQHSEWNKLFEQSKLTGSFSLFDTKRNTYLLSDREQFAIQYSPASTFKICNTIIGLETGAIPNENYTQKWDGIKRNPVWDKDHNLQSAFKNSVVWYYQHVARKVGGTKMKAWLEKLNYGNCDTTGGIDKFWLEGNLKISPKQQINFLKRLNNNQLLCSPKTIETLKRIMVSDSTANYTVYSKTGWGFNQTDEIGWHVGFVTTADNVYYFANCIQTPSKQMEQTENAVAFDKARTDITYQILKQLNIIK